MFIETMKTKCRLAGMMLISILISGTCQAQTCFDCGDGNMGSFIANQDTVLPAGTYQFTEFYIAEGVSVQFTGNSSVKIQCKGSVIIDGKLLVTGANGGSAQDNLTSAIPGAGAGGGFNGGAGIPGTLGSHQGQNGNGPGRGPAGVLMNPGGGGGGYGSNGSGCSVSSSNMYGDYLLNGTHGGSGGGSGAAINGYSSGAGGGGGGDLSIYSCNPIIIGVHGEVRVDGGNGGNGFQKGSGGGGGSGGTIYFVSRLIVNNGIISAQGGLGGICPGISSPCMQGGNGGQGRIRFDNTEVHNSGTIIPDYYSKLLFNAGIRRVVDARCNNTSTGFIRARASGGERPYSFKWSNGSHANELTNVPAGVYTVTITDAEGCSVTETATVSEPTPVTSSVVSYPPTCDNAQNSIVMYQAAGGTPFPYQNSVATTQWSNSSSYGLLFTFDLASVTNLKRIHLLLDQTGAQHVKVFYCQGDGSLQINNSSAWTLVNDFQFNYGSTEDEIPVDLPSLSNLPAGKHTLYVYSFNSKMLGVSSTVLGNTFNFDHQLTIYAGMARGSSINPFATSSAGIMNLSGRITYEIESPNGGSYLYGYNPTDGPVKTGLPPGTYNTVITDVMGCTSSVGFHLAQPDALNITVTDTQSPRCSDSKDGKIQVALSAKDINYYAATPPSFLLPESGVFLKFNTAEEIQLKGIELYSSSPITADIYLKRGSYSGFENSASAWTLVGHLLNGIPDAAGRIQLMLPALQVLDIDRWSICVRTTSGTINSHPYRENFISSPVQHLNSTGFSSSAPFQQTVLLQGSYFAGTLLYSTDAGQLNTSWNNSATGTTVTGLAAGNYTVTVNYGNQCTTQKTISITAPTPLVPQSQLSMETDHNADGSIEVNGTGGTPPYYIQWPLNGVTGPSMNNLPAGDYPVFIADANGCFIRDTIHLQRFETPIKPEGWLTILPNPGHGFIKVGEEVKGMDACLLSVFDIRGRLVLQEQTTINRLMTEGLDLRHLIDANYFIQVQDEDQVFHAKAIFIH